MFKEFNDYKEKQISQAQQEIEPTTDEENALEAAEIKNDNALVEEIKDGKLEVGIQSDINNKIAPEEVKILEEIKNPETVKDGSENGHVVDGKLEVGVVPVDSIEPVKSTRGRKPTTRGGRGSRGGKK